jgi:SRSO17 transposase
MMIEEMARWDPELLKSAGITESGVEGLGKKLLEYLKGFGGFFARSEGRENFAVYIKGLLSKLERKSIETIALNFTGPSGVRALQEFLGSNRAADDDGLKSSYQQALSAHISEDGGMITADSSGFPKKGKKSVGVARQYCGVLGKVENCQVGVFAGYTSAKGYGLVDYRLYMPQSWMGEENKDRRDECHAPENLEFKTQVEMASEMIRDIARSGLYKAKWVGADSAFGRSKEFLDGLPEGMLYFADIVFNMKVYPLAALGGVRRPADKAVEACVFAEDGGIPWEKIILAEGAKGPIIADEKCVRVVECRDGKPYEEAWLYIRRFADNTHKYSISNAPSDAPKEELRKAATMRWPIEQSFGECKDNLGMDHYEARSWTAWHRHILFVLIAHLFLLDVRLGLKKKNLS